MASPVPEKLQPLHNFSLTHLKWKNHRSGRSRLAGEVSSSSPPVSNPWREPSLLRSHTHAPSHPQRRQTSPPNVSRRPSSLHKQSPSPMRYSELETDPNNAATQFIDKPGKRIISESSTKSVEYNIKGKRSNKTALRFREKSKHYDAVAEEGRSSTPMDYPVPPPAAAEDESSPKTWNLRPRRAPVNHKQSTGGLSKIGTSRLQEVKTSHETNTNKQLSEQNANNHSDSRKSKKHKFSIALSRGEIEEDFLLWTGSKPSRRPKKRPRAIQKQLDNLFPGLWLDCITADSYKVPEAS